MTSKSGLMAIPWLACVAAGFAFAWRYEGTPGRPSRGSAWPVGTALRRDGVRPTIVQFLHSVCPCSRVGLLGLAKLAGREGSKARWLFVVVGEPRQEEESAGESLRLARSVPRATVTFDPNGTEARRFGAATSGQTYAFAADGTLLFQGGVTVARGHWGDSDGLAAIEAVVEGRRVLVRSTPVYGCALYAEAS